jgi:hypothetical protein
MLRDKVTGFAGIQKEPTVKLFELIPVLLNDEVRGIHDHPTLYTGKIQEMVLQLGCWTRC